MDDKRLENLLRESRPSMEPTPGHRTALRERLTRHEDQAPSLTAIIFAPLAVALLVGAMLIATPVDQGENPSPLTGPDWSSPVTSSEVLPWTIVQSRPSTIPSEPNFLPSTIDFDFQ